MSAAMKANFLLNLAYNISGLLFHLITFPYVSRILFASGIGLIQFYQSIINYIILLSSLGIPLYAVREIAKVRDNKQLCSKVAVEILILHLFLTLLGYLIVFALLLSAERLWINASLFLLLSTHLLLNSIGAYWFYQGVEDFKFIAFRAIAIRSVALIAMFMFVKDNSDLLAYAIIIVAADAGNNIFNFYRLKQYVEIRKNDFLHLNPMRHLKPALKIFVLNLVISIYVNLDTVMLGFIKNETAVGYYSAATKIIKSFLAIVQSLGGVLLPRFSNMTENNQIKELRLLSDKSLSFILAFSLPLTVGVIFMAKPLIHLFCGNNYDPSILTIQIMAPIIVFIAVSNIAGPQILYALGKENMVILSTLSGAIINVSLNMILIPEYSQYGAGISTVIAEFIVMLLMICFVWKYVPLQVFSSNNLHYYGGTCGILILLLWLQKIIHGEFIYCIIGVITSIALYSIILFLNKDRLLLHMIKTIMNR